MTYRAWVCESCRYPSRVREHVWECPGCGKDACESCFDRYAHCKDCAKGKTDEELRLAANEKGFDFEAPEDDCLEAQDNTPSKGPFTP